ncbi:hypothetical protein [Velocimicrobium porci]|uniref:Uncharacterized protein n=1 Tax=Velocimicrobium porci TaxID=2606634 RepID=A0A6L5Y0K7_9FIRM|nr:hypothetical protein [Velocimicrobium porci]MSS64522.1 hypothetical protein [Velocimicrobium porci]
MLVQLGLNIFEDEEQNYPFKMKVELIGEFELRNVDIENEKDIKKYYANANIDPLILPTVNIWKTING